MEIVCEVCTHLWSAGWMNAVSICTLFSTFFFIQFYTIQIAMPLGPKYETVIITKMNYRAKTGYVFVFISIDCPISALLRMIRVLSAKLDELLITSKQTIASNMICWNRRKGNTAPKFCVERIVGICVYLFFKSRSPHPPEKGGEKKWSLVILKLRMKKRMMFSIYFHVSRK